MPFTCQHCGESYYRPLVHKRHCSSSTALETGKRRRVEDARRDHAEDTQNNEVGGLRALWQRRERRKKEKNNGDTPIRPSRRAPLDNEGPIEEDHEQVRSNIFWYRHFH